MGGHPVFFSSVRSFCQVAAVLLGCRVVGQVWSCCCGGVPVYYATCLASHCAACLWRSAAV